MSTIISRVLNEILEGGATATYEFEDNSEVDAEQLVKTDLVDTINDLTNEVENDDVPVDLLDVINKEVKN